jgi:vitamin B12/bleomycin/antimicrobial peptide transport system ATP-binding/permease protein
MWKILMKRARRPIMSDAWRLAKLYWISEERWSAWGLLLGVIVLTLGNVYIGVRINEWNRAFYNALQAFDSAELFRQLGIFGILIACGISISVNALYLNQMLQIRWRRWLTRTYIASWLAGRAYYHLQFLSTTDNPDQRISEDLSLFTIYVMNLSVGLISSLVSLGSFLVILWGLSGSADIPIGAWGTVHRVRPSGRHFSSDRHRAPLLWPADYFGRINAGGQCVLFCPKLALVHH